MSDSEIEILQRESAALRAELEQLKQDREHEVAVLNDLIQISTQLNSTLKLSELLQLIMNSAKRLIRADACSVALRDEETGELVFAMAVGAKSEGVREQRVPAGQGIAGRVVQSGEPLIVNSVKDDPQFYRRIDESTGFETRNILAVPLKVRDRPIGVVEIINSQGREIFDQRDLKLAEAFTSQAAVAVDNANLYQKLAEGLVTSRMSYRL